MLNSEDWLQEAEESARIAEDLHGPLRRKQTAKLLRLMATAKVVRGEQHHPDDISFWGELRNAGVPPRAIRVMAVVLAFSQQKQSQFKGLLQSRSRSVTEVEGDVLRELGYEKDPLIQAWIRKGLNIFRFIDAVPELRDAAFRAVTAPLTAALVAAERKRLATEALEKDFLVTSSTKVNARVKDFATLMLVCGFKGFSTKEEPHYGLVGQLLYLAGLETPGKARNSYGAMGERARRRMKNKDVHFGYLLWAASPTDE